MERVDVAIVGGGPAGTSAGRAAAEQGAEAVVVEKGVPRADRDGLGPDSTDAAGFLDYWTELAGFGPDEFPDSVKLAELDGAEFIGPNESVLIEETGIDSAYPGFGFTFQRARFDDWLRDRAETAGAQYRVGTSVTGVDTDLSGGVEHTLTLSDGESIVADALVLADGPQRTVTGRVLDQFLPADESLSERLPSTEANHIAYQEHRRMPEELFPEDRIQFWWGVMPGHTAYPWIFPNDDNVARIGLTMPIGLDIDDYDVSEWALLREDDDKIPQGRTYVERLLEREFPDYDLDDFPLVEDRGKTDGTETYPISSTRPIDSPTDANVAVVGGAMGATSAFHEGGDHVAVRTGSLAGELAATDALDRYNDAWKDALESEILRNVAFADLVEGYGPATWDRVFATVNAMQTVDGSLWRQALAAGTLGLKTVAGYKWRKFQYRDGGYVQLAESEYTV
ncbi:NAD(P)/FAD-dependent oxidoreductase [Halomicrobium sp. LC1Hm]|uniref:NAD(P)/FAD-dependent oxidoreductase n=1 Tax=Halomicrobium sp. LC1Hm TaxID=2610902 RepID=UPI0012983A1F|nr:NAD(P)/FAD-dependent oxidoreductase [Halomicrobium sp. LC1Hm]QGA82940.1 Electron-transferring-flavoprotein dehydrogenase [Halomicrobium sp. LC1Hm]